MHRAATLAEVRALLAADERVTYSISNQLLQNEESEDEQQRAGKGRQAGAGRREEPRQPEGSCPPPPSRPNGHAAPGHGGPQDDRSPRREAKDDDQQQQHKQQQRQPQSGKSQQQEERHRSPAPLPATVQQQAYQARGGVAQEEPRPHSGMKESTRSPMRMSPRPKSSLARAPHPAKPTQPQQAQQHEHRGQHEQQQQQQQQQQAQQREAHAPSSVKVATRSSHGQQPRRQVPRRKQPPQRQGSLPTSPSVPNHLKWIPRSNSATEMRRPRGRFRGRRRSSLLGPADYERMSQQSPEARRIKHEAIRAFLAKRMEDASVFVTTKLADPRLRRHILPLVHRGTQNVGKIIGSDARPGGGLSNEQLRKDCSDLVASIMEIYERDFVTLCHGHRGVVFAEPHPSAIRFLLTGIGLAILYESIPPKSDALEKLAHETLIIISARDTWIRALQLFGPVPMHRLQQQQRDITKRSHTVRVNKAECPSPMRERSPSAYRLAATERDIAINKALSEAAVCPQCNQSLPQPPAHAALIRCSNCGVQVIRYFVDLINGFRTTLEHDVVAQAELSPRMRTFSF